MSFRIAAGLMKATRLMRKRQVRDATRAFRSAVNSLRPQPQMKSAVARLLRTVQDLQATPQKTVSSRTRAESSKDVAGQGHFITARFSNGAGVREYKVYVPVAPRGDALALVVMLHGCKQNPDDFAAGTRMNALAEEQGLIVVYPSQARSANGFQCWNWFQTRDQSRDQGEPSLIAGITREVMSKYEVDPQRVYVAGLSAGGAMAAIMAATYPDLYAAVGIHSGLPYAAASDVNSAYAAMRGDTVGGALEIPGDSPALRSVPAIIFHGDADATVHPDNGDQLHAQAAPLASALSAQGIVQRGSVSGRAYTTTLYRDRKGKSLLEHWVVHGAGHAWFGGSKAGSYTDPSGPDASREMVRFFLQHA